MTENQLKLNDDKTEALLFPFSSSLKPSTIHLPDSIILGSHNIPFSDSARNLGFILVSKLSLKKHVIKICQTAYFELKRISSIRRFLTEDGNTFVFIFHLPAPPLPTKRAYYIEMPRPLACLSMSALQCRNGWMGYGEPVPDPERERERERGGGGAED